MTKKRYIVYVPFGGSEEYIGYANSKEEAIASVLNGDGAFECVGSSITGHKHVTAELQEKASDSEASNK